MVLAQIKKQFPHIIHAVGPRLILKNVPKFKCRNCGYKADADYNGSVNVRSRRSIPQINVYTPYRKVKEILVTIFSRHDASDMEKTTFRTDLQDFLG